MRLYFAVSLQGMADAMRAMLDELMGKERNVPLDQRKGTDIRFNDPEVCKYVLAGSLCPYRLFKNTKSDLGKYIGLGKET